MQCKYEYILKKFTLRLPRLFFSKRDSRGFTLLEILATLIILTLGIVAIAQVFNVGLISSVDVEDTTIAMNLTQKRIEEFKNLDFDAGIVDETKANVTGFSGFQREVEVDEVETDLKEVTVTTYWTYKSSELSTSLVTYISRN